MYHSRFKNTHYQSGYHWGKQLKNHGVSISNQHTFVITDERKLFAKKCLPVYQEYFPEILDEIKGIADGQAMSYEQLYTFLLSMYCFEFDNHCTCFAFYDDDHIIFGRNSDFLVELEKLYMNCLYKLDDVYAFQANTTAFVQMEDGVNECGLAVGLTFVYPSQKGYGFNAGMLVRYILEKCKNTKEAISFLQRIPMASCQTLTIADVNKNIAVVECCPEHLKVILPKEKEQFVAATNTFHELNIDHLKKGKNIDDWRSEERYQVACQALLTQQRHFSWQCASDILSGKYGFMCQYDRKRGADTVWSVIYDLQNLRIWRVEGNPSRKKYKEDHRFHFRQIE